MLPIARAVATLATVQAEEMPLIARAEGTLATVPAGVGAIVLDPEIFPAGAIEGAMPSAVEVGSTEPGLERMPAAVHRAWAPAEVLEAEVAEEAAEEAEDVAAEEAVAGAGKQS